MLCRKMMAITVPPLQRHFHRGHQHARHEGKHVGVGHERTQWYMFETVQDRGHDRLVSTDHQEPGQCQEEEQLSHHIAFVPQCRVVQRGESKPHLLPHHEPTHLHGDQWHRRHQSDGQSNENLQCHQRRARDARSSDSPTGVTTPMPCSTG